MTLEIAAKGSFASLHAFCVRNSGLTLSKFRAQLWSAELFRASQTSVAHHHSSSYAEVYFSVYILWCGGFFNSWTFRRGDISIGFGIMGGWNQSQVCMLA